MQQCFWIQVFLLVGIFHSSATSVDSISLYTRSLDEQYCRFQAVEFLLNKQSTNNRKEYTNHVYCDLCDKYSVNNMKKKIALWLNTQTDVDRDAIAIIPYDRHKTSSLLNTLFSHFDFIFAHQFPLQSIHQVDVPDDYFFVDTTTGIVFCKKGSDFEGKVNTIYKYYFGKQNLNFLRIPHSSFVSGDAFRELADHILDDCITTMDPALVKDKDIVFLKSVYTDEFIEKYHPYIDAEYILITHNDDNEVNEKYLAFLNEDKLLAWFALNVSIEHTKLHPVPIGIPNRYLLPSYELVEKLREEKSPKNTLGYLNFATSTYPLERELVLRLFCKESYCCLRRNISNYEYIKDLHDAKFVFAPRGNGIDTYRAWEALYVGSIPIIKCGPAMQKLYQDLPVLFVEDWNVINKEYLNDKYLEMQDRQYHYEKLEFQYWKNLIQKVKEEA